MQAINRAAPSPLFTLALFGTAAASIGVGIVALRRRSGTSTTLLAAGCGLYLASVITTMVFHIPRNNTLDRLDPTSFGAATAWHRYVSEWTIGNHVRTLLALGAAVPMILSLNEG